MTDRLVRLKTVLWALVGLLMVVTVARFGNGLGAVTNLSNEAPWGLWVGFDVMAGVALAAGGFVLAATVYIFGLERYRPFVRPAILTAFLGYLAVAIGLLYDLGLPWHIWHPAIHWQHTSVLFEVASCVMLYLTVLSLEFAPVILEHSLFDRPLFHKIRAILQKAVLPLVIAGIVLSTLHQSSLGSLFLPVPHRVHPLWYSPIIYVLYFLSAVGLGFLMVTLESLLSGYFFGHKIRTDLLSRLAMAGGVAMIAYAALRIGDLGIRGKLGLAFDGSWQGNLFLLEIFLSAILPAILLFLKPMRQKVAGLAVCSALVVAGMIGYRINVSIVSVARPEWASYFPSWTELAVSLGIVSALALVFIFFVENLKVYGDDHGIRPAARRRGDPGTVQSLLPPGLFAYRGYSLAFIVAAAVTLILLPREAVLGTQPDPRPVEGPRAVMGTLDPEAAPKDRLALAKDGPRRLMIIDGNRTVEDPRSNPAEGAFLLDHGFVDAVLFDHEGHAERLGGEAACGTCHHLNKPLDENTSCWECHRDMFSPVSTFDHSFHIRATGENEGCVKCHEDPGEPRTVETAKTCGECHAESVAANSRVVMETPAGAWKDAVSYLDAMHGLCKTCHLQESEEHGDCITCHDADRVTELREMIPGGNRGR